MPSMENGTLQGINISHLGKMENHRLKSAGDCMGYISFQEGICTIIYL